MMAPTDNDDLPSGFLNALCRHVISLSWLDAKTEPDGPTDDPDAYDLKAFSVSAFVISVRHIWFLVTAGHILRDLDRRLQAGRRIVKSRLIDGIASNKSFPAIPFTLGDTPQWYVYNDGLDYALIPLSPSFALQLIAGGVSALSEDAWIDVPDSPDGYFLLGFPNQGAEISITSHGNEGNVNVRLGTPLLPIQPVDDPPDVLKRGNERFYARVPISTGQLDGKTVTLTDIDGMSGGPIFAVQQADEDRFQYWVIAVQSGWTEKSRVLAACPIQPLVDAIVKCVGAHSDELDGHEIETDAPEYGA